MNRDGFAKITVGTEPFAPQSLRSRAAKRAMDIIVATLLLLAALPVLLLAALTVVLESRGPVLYRAHRVGRGGLPLNVLKLRKMYAGATGLPLTAADDERFTRIGRFLSVTHIDEIPQLWQVITGQMSMIGPRPEDSRFVDLHPEAFDKILSVRPGISGWTQLLFIQERQIIAAADSVQAYVDQLLPTKVALDVLYTTSRRFRYDLKLLLWTPLVMLLRFQVVFVPELRQFQLVRAAAPTLPAPLPTRISGGMPQVPKPRGVSSLESR